MTFCSLRLGWPCRGWPGEISMMCIYELCSPDEGYTIELGRRAWILAHSQAAIARQ